DTDRRVALHRPTEDDGIALTNGGIVEDAPLQRPDFNLASSPVGGQELYPARREAFGHDDRRMDCRAVGRGAALHAGAAGSTSGAPRSCAWIVCGCRYGRTAACSG